jgi:hypothetical protein
MKKTILLMSLAFLFAVQASSQVTKTQLKGVWGMVALGKTGEDTAVTFVQDSAITSLFSNIVFQNLDDLIANARTDEEKMAYGFMSYFKSMFIQFDAATAFGEGGLPDNKDEKVKVKKGTYKLAGNKLITTNSGGKTQNFTVAYKNGFLVLTGTQTGMVMYMKKISDTLY